MLCSILESHSLDLVRGMHTQVLRLLLISGIHPRSTTNTISSSLLEIVRHRGMDAWILEHQVISILTSSSRESNTILPPLTRTTASPRPSAHTSPTAPKLRLLRTNDVRSRPASVRCMLF